MAVDRPVSRTFVSQGHLIDSGILASMLNLIIEEGADYEILDFHVGKTNLEPSRIELEVCCTDSEHLESVTEKLIEHGCYEKLVGEVVSFPAPADGTVPDEFYSTTNHRTEVYYRGKWREVAGQRMDAVIVLGDSGAACRKLRDVRAGDRIVCSSESVRVFPPERRRSTDAFGFMSGEVSSERSVEIAVEHLAAELARSRRAGGRVVAVAGPVVVHAGGGPAFEYLVREGYVDVLLAGNALAVHDAEAAFFGTSLGLDLRTGRPAAGAHRNHMRAINRIRVAGSTRKAVETGVLRSGIMYEIVRREVPFCLAGSIRDDGPLPDTITDMIEAQETYASLIKGATLVLMLSSMLHSIGVGNMLPSDVATVCVDINPAVVTKLADRGSSHAVGIVSDVGFFLRALADRLRGRGGPETD